jgi:hypothetical protein
VTPLSTRPHSIALCAGSGTSFARSTVTPLTLKREHRTRELGLKLSEDEVEKAVLTLGDAVS